MESLEEHLLNVHVILISAAAWFILWTLRKILKGIDTNHWVSRYKPLYPAFICQAFVWIPGALPAQQDPTIGYRILLGFWCGLLASTGYQVVKRVLLPRGIELPDKPEELLPAPVPADDSPAAEGEWESPAISSEKENLSDTRRETPATRDTFTPPRPEDLFKPPKM